MHLHDISIPAEIVVDAFVSMSIWLVFDQILLIVWFHLHCVHGFHFTMGNHENIEFMSLNIEGHWSRSVVFWGWVKFGWLRWSHWIGDATMKIIPTWLFLADWTLCTWNNWRLTCIWKYCSSIYWSGLTLMCGIWCSFDNSKSVLGVFAWWWWTKCLGDLSMLLLV